jgi:putative membrane protein
VTQPDSAQAGSGRFEVSVTASNHFAWLRTRMALERTLMAWVRTAVSMIGFGFTIVQFFEKLGAMQGIAAAARPQAPRYLGLALIACGVAALLISVWQYRRVMSHLTSGSFKALSGIDDSSMRTPTYAIALFLILVGLFAFIAVYLRAF